MRLPHFIQKRSLLGFTLIEILVVISIIAVIVTIAIVSYTTINKQSRDTKRKSDLEQLRSSLEMFRSDRGYYPSVGMGSWTLASGLNTGDPTTGLVSTYISGVPADPKSSQAYYYTGTSLVGSNYYGYCLCAQLEFAPASTLTCSPSAPAACNYVVKNP